MLLATTLREKIPDPRNSKLYQSFMKKKNTKSLKQSKIITQQLKHLKTQSGIIEHPKTLHIYLRLKYRLNKIYR